MSEYSKMVRTYACRIIPFLWMVMLSILAVNSASVFAQEKEWWFDIELIMYKRDIAPSEIAERFPEQFNQASNKPFADPLSDVLYPDLAPLYSALPVCFVEPVKPKELGFEFDSMDNYRPVVAIELTELVGSVEDQVSAFDNNPE